MYIHRQVFKTQIRISKVKASGLYRETDTAFNTMESSVVQVVMVTPDFGFFRSKNANEIHR